MFIELDVFLITAPLGARYYAAPKRSFRFIDQYCFYKYLAPNGAFSALYWHKAALLKSIGKTDHEQTRTEH